MTKWISIALMGGLAAIVAIWLVRPGDRMADGTQAMQGGGSALASGGADSETIISPVLPDTLSERAQMGERAFVAKCAECHGENAGGLKRKGPPLVHRIYEPAHHADYAFVLAVQNGVRAHHWPFGDMAPVSGLTEADVGAIVAYVRELQQANGIN